MVAKTDQYQRAIDKAHSVGGAKRVKWLGGFSFEVRGSDRTYRADVQGDNARCECPAGAKGRPCYHLGCVWLWKVGRQMGARVQPVMRTLPRHERQQEPWL